jgi:hypothetical protein
MDQRPRVVERGAVTTGADAIDGGVAGEVRVGAAATAGWRALDIGSAYQLRSGDAIR